MQKRLLVSIHDVGPRFSDQIERLAGRLANTLGDPHFAMLVVANHWGDSPLAGNRTFAQKLRRWADQGVEMFVHGWFHRDEAAHSGLARFKARHMTAGEGEFLGLSVDEARRRMAAGKTLLEDITGREAAGCIAPAWLYGPGAMEALATSGFVLAEDHMRVWHPATGATLARGPVVTWASRSVMRTASSLAFATVARTALRPLETVRVAVHPGDLSKPSILTSIDRTLEALTAKRAVSRYSALLA
jgi:predicted deacetylase